MQTIPALQNGIKIVCIAFSDIAIQASKVRVVRLLIVYSTWTFIITLISFERAVITNCINRKGNIYLSKQLINISYCSGLNYYEYCYKLSMLRFASCSVLLMIYILCMFSFWIHYNLSLEHYSYSRKFVIITNYFFVNWY